MSLRPPLGQQIHLALVRQGPDAAFAIADEAGQPDLFARVSAVAGETPSPSFLHSALCAMSLPVRRPADEHAPIIRQDGQYTLVINPKPVVESIDGRQSLRSLGVPYGSLPRLVLIHIMTEAVRTKSRHIVLGQDLYRLDAADGLPDHQLWAARLGHLDQGATRPAAGLRVDDPMGKLAPTRVIGSSGSRKSS